MQFLVVFVVAVWGRFPCLARTQPEIDDNYLADRNAEAVATPPEERAWPAIYEPLLAMEPIPDFMNERRWPFGTGYAGTTPPTAEQWQTARAYISEHQGHLAELRTAAGLPALGIVLSDVVDQDYAPLAAAARGYAFKPDTPTENPPMWDILLPHLGDMRRTAKLLATDALIAAQDGQSGRVIDDIGALNNLARLSGNGLSLIEQLNAVQIETTAHETIAQILTEHVSELDEADLTAWSSTSQRLSAREPLIDLEGERAMVLDVLQRTYSPAGQLTKHGARFIATKSVGPSKAAAESRKLVEAAATRDTVVSVLDQLLAAGARDIETPHWQRDGWHVAALKDAVGWDSWSARFCAIDAVMNSYNRVANQCERLRQRRTATSVIIALCRHRLRHDVFPENLAGLDADLLDHVPIDRFSGEPLRWTVGESGAVLYSIGNDRDDDGGSPIADPDSLNWLPPGDTRAGRGGLQDGDWVLWRVPLKND